MEGSPGINKKVILNKRVSIYWKLYFILFFIKFYLNIKLKTKMTIYTTIVEPILTYGCECWQITEKGKKTQSTQWKWTF